MEHEEEEEEEEEGRFQERDRENEDATQYRERRQARDCILLTLLYGVPMFSRCSDNSVTFAAARHQHLVDFGLNIW